jgi:hypothetical protein
MAKVICSICGVETSKRKTYAVGDGKRACREHEGVTEQAEKKKRVEKNRLLSQKKAEKDRKFFGHRQPEPIPKSPHCWVCRKDGIGAREFYMQKVIDIEKHHIVHGTTNPFTDKEHPMNVRTEQPVIFTIDRSAMSEEVRNKVWHRTHRDFQVLLQIAGLVSICADCCLKVGFDPTPKITPEQLKQGMNITAVLKPVYHKEALRQLRRDN